MRHADARAIGAEFIGGQRPKFCPIWMAIAGNRRTAWLDRRPDSQCIRPTVLITHWKGCFHGDHNNTPRPGHNGRCSKSGTAAFNARTSVAIIPRAGVISPKTGNDMEKLFCPIFTLDVTEVFVDYLKLLKTQRP
jgi:hypothetical protein